MRPARTSVQTPRTKSCLLPPKWYSHSSRWIDHRSCNKPYNSLAGDISPSTRVWRWWQGRWGQGTHVSSLLVFLAEDLGVLDRGLVRLQASKSESIELMHKSNKSTTIRLIPSFCSCGESLHLEILPSSWESSPSSFSAYPITRMQKQVSLKDMAGLRTSHVLWGRRISFKADCLPPTWKIKTID